MHHWNEKYTTIPDCKWFTAKPYKRHKGNYASLFIFLFHSQAFPIELRRNKFFWLIYLWYNLFVCTFVHKFFCCYSQNKVFVVGIWCSRCHTDTSIYIYSYLYYMRAVSSTTVKKTTILHYSRKHAAHTVDRSVRCNCVRVCTSLFPFCCVLLRTHVFVNVHVCVCVPHAERCIHCVLSNTNETFPCIGTFTEPTYSVRFFGMYTLKSISSSDSLYM